MAGPALTCLLSAALAFHVPVPAMEAIQVVEGGQAGQEVCGNVDGSCDLGPFQVNDRAWVDTIAGQLAVDPTVVRSTLKDDACWNAQVAAWILRQMLDEANGDLAVAVGDYHSHLPFENAVYRQKIAAAYDRLYPVSGPPVLPATPVVAELETLRSAPVLPIRQPGTPASHVAVITPAGPAQAGGTELRWGHAGGRTVVFRGTVAQDDKAP